MLAIRLFRIGKKNQPFFKIVVTDRRNPPRAGRFVEQVGNYNPITKEKVLKKERIQYWLSQGAKASATVHNLLVKEGVLDGRKISVHKKSKKSGEELSAGTEEKKPASADTSSSGEAVPAKEEASVVVAEPTSEKEEVPSNEAEKPKPAESESIQAGPPQSENLGGEEEK